MPNLLLQNHNRVASTTPEVPKYIKIKEAKQSNLNSLQKNSKIMKAKQLNQTNLK